MNIFISDLQEQSAVDPAVVQQAAAHFLRRLQCPETCELSIALVDDQEIRRLNRAYRGIDRSTDVLSFAQQEGDAPPRPETPDAAMPLLLGDVILSVETTRRQAAEHGVAFEQELAFLVLHGILHLLGYDHHTDHDACQMERLEHEIFNTLQELHGSWPGS
jgi:probable rRNA maturation factor